MASPGPSIFGQTGDRLIDAATNGTYWSLSGSRTLNWSFADGFNGEVWTNPASLLSGITTLLSTISYYANVNFNYVGYWRTPSVAYAAGSDITFSLSQVGVLFPSSSVYAEAFFPNTQVAASLGGGYAGAPGDFFLNINSPANSLPSYAPGSLGWFVALHEVGHALGLKHPHDDGGTGRPTLSAIGLSQYDHDWFTVMSYDESYPSNRFQWHPATFMIEDVLALQYLYGPNMSANAGDTTFTLPLSNLFATIWDPTGNNTIDVTSATGGWTIFLPNAQLSNLVSTKAGVAIPSAEYNLAVPHNLYWLAGEITNFDGSQFADTVTGTDENDVMRGNGGNDILDGD